MKTIRTVSVVGGDARQIYTAQRLEEYGFDVCLFGLDGERGRLLPRAETLAQALQSDAAVLPLPCTRDGRTLHAPDAAGALSLRAIAEHIPPGTVCFAGMAPERFTEALSAKGVTMFDYYRDEALTVKNARLTAEGVLSEIIARTPVTVWGMSAAVTGYGRVSRYVCRALQALGASVTVYARDPVQRAQAETDGLRASPVAYLPEQSHRFDVIVNTVPAPVVTADAVANARRDCLFVETASAPYGVDFDACERSGRRLVKAFSQPGKTAPKTAGILIAETVFGMIKEANQWNP